MRLSFENFSCYWGEAVWRNFRSGILALVCKVPTQPL
jgi:hypothetical protein